MIYPLEVHVEKVPGPISFETYVAGVVTAENGMARHAAQQAQAVAARTFVLRAMRDRPGLGSAQKFAKVNFCRYVIDALRRKLDYMEFYGRNFGNVEMSNL